MGKGMRVAKGNTEKKDVSTKKNNKTTAASSKKTTKSSSFMGEGSRTCRASLPPKGKKDEPS
ncbi:hypothetical protein A2U01_0106533, partial [Trifolium medium]|nr:hypothetical protein [Trifolium medium]